MTFVNIVKTLGNGFSALVNGIVALNGVAALGNGSMVLVDDVSALGNSFMALTNSVAAHINGGAALIEGITALVNDIASIHSFAAHVNDMRACKNTGSAIGFATHVNNTSICKDDVSVNGLTAHVDNTSACKGFIPVNSLTALVNSIAAFVNGITALANDPLYMFIRQGDSSGFNVFVSVNGPLCLQFPFQPPPGAYTSIFVFIHQRVYSIFDPSFLKGTTLPVPLDTPLHRFHFIPL